jgi:steroid delta-isomerase-like uncharacterized protein
MSMSVEENKALIRRYIDAVINGRALDRLDEFASANFVDHSTPPGWPSGLAGARQSFETFFTAFPDFKVNIDFMLGERDEVVSHATFQGTHEAEFNGIPATGKFFTTNGVEILRVEDGKIAERWFRLDVMKMLQQLGLMPSMG